MQRRRRDAFWCDDVPDLCNWARPAANFFHIFVPSPQKIVPSPRKFTEDPLCDVQEPSEPPYLRYLA